MQPITQNNPNLYKGPSSSAEFNKLRNDMHYDVSTLFELANQNDDTIKSNMDVLVRENFFMQNKIIELESRVEKIKQDLLYRADGYSKQRLIKSFHSLEGITEGDSGKSPHINTVYGYLTVPPADAVSKLSYQTEDGQVVIPESLDVQVFESTNIEATDTNTGMPTYYELDDQDLYKAFDRSRNSFWVHSSSFPETSGVSEVYGILHIKLPLDTMNNIFANTLVLNPFPEYSMTIRDIQFKGQGEQWHRLPNFPVEKDQEGQAVPVPIENAGKLTFSFPKAEMTEVQILLTQPYWFASEGQREFTYGFQEIELEHRVSGGGEAEVISEFSLEGTTKRFSTIEEPVAIPLVGSLGAIEELVEHRLYYNKDLTNEFGFGNEIMAPIQKVYVRTTIREGAEGVPMVRKLQLDYTYKELDEY